MNDIIPTTFLADTKKLKTDIERNFLELSARLFAIYTKELWRGSFISYADFLSDLRLSKAEDSKLRTIYAKLIAEWQFSRETLSAIGISASYLIASKSPDKEKAREMVELAGELRREELRDALRVLGSGEHECSGDEWIMLKCAICGALRRKG